LSVGWPLSVRRHSVSQRGSQARCASAWSKYWWIARHDSARINTSAAVQRSKEMVRSLSIREA